MQKKREKTTHTHTHTHTHATVFTAFELGGGERYNVQEQPPVFPRTTEMVHSDCLGVHNTAEAHDEEKNIGIFLFYK